MIADSFSSWMLCYLIEFSPHLRTEFHWSDYHFGRGIKGVRIVKDKRLEISRGGVVEWGKNKAGVTL